METSAGEGAPAQAGGVGARTPGSAVGDDAPASAEPGDFAPVDPVTRTPPPHNTGVVVITLSSECVRIGDVLTVTIKGPPKGGLGAVIGFSDSQAHGAMITGETDANGLYVWRVPIEPTVPPGKATVLATVSGPNWSQEGGGSADKPFTVADLTGC